MSCCFGILKKMLFIKSVFDIKTGYIFGAHIRCSQNQYDDLKSLVREEVEINSFFLRLRKLRIERSKKQNNKHFLLFNVIN